MKFDPRLFYDLAVDLNKKCTKESEYRSIINRSYYAAFGFGKIIVGITSGDASVHQETIKRLKNYTHVRAAKAGKILETLFERRKKADYNYTIEIKKWECQASIDEANEIIEHLKNFQEDDV